MNKKLINSLVFHCLTGGIVKEVIKGKMIGYFSHHRRLFFVPLQANENPSEAHQSLRLYRCLILYKRLNALVFILII